jgi:hypothetical protein
MVMARYGPEVAKREAAAAAADHVGPRQRILVALRSLVTAQPMIELTLLLRDPAQRQPVYLVHATRDDESVEHNVGRAEKMLHDAVVLCSSADVPAEISTSIDHTISAALVRSTKELQASHLVLDWNFEPPSGNSVLGSTVDELLRTNSSTILLFRSRHPVTTTRQIALAVPPAGFNREALAAAATTVKRVAQQLGAPIEVLADDLTWTQHRAVLETAKPEVKMKHHRLEHWDSLHQALQDRTSTSDLLVILGARNAAPEIARAPIAIAERFPDASMALIYGTDKSLRSDVSGLTPAPPVTEPASA